MSKVMRARRRILTLGLLLPLAAAGVYGGCGEEARDTTFEVDLVRYEGQATQTALLALLAHKAEATSAEKTVFDAPAAQATLAASAPPMFRWHVEGATARSTTPARSPGRAALLGALLGPPRAAAAHDPPVNGRAYFLVFSSGGATRLGVFTTNLDFTPSAEDWSMLAASPQPIEAAMISGVFSDGELAAGGGPFLGDPLVFSITP